MRLYDISSQRRTSNMRTSADKQARMKTNYRRIVFMFTSAAFLLLLLINFEALNVTWNDFDLGVSYARLSRRFNSSPQGQRTILFWNKFFDEAYFYFDKGDLSFRNCSKYTNCFVTNDRKLLPIENFDAILFHGNEVDVGDLPAKRDPRQRYFFVNLESPANRPIPHHFFEDYFNATMTYRLDSDVPWHYGSIRLKNASLHEPMSGNGVWEAPVFDGSYADHLVGYEYTKKKLAVWFVSNCNTRGKREDFVAQLQQYIDVDVIGQCGTIDCPRSKDCYEAVEGKYFFYLSFENSICQDYVTEKLFRVMRYDMVPVVYGGANYSLFAPPRSYIDALDFESPKELADRLIELSQNWDEYVKYFWWKNFYASNESFESRACKLCEVLNEEVPSKTYDPLSLWYSYDKCLNPSSIFNLHEIIKHMKIG